MANTGLQADRRGKWGRDFIETLPETLAGFEEFPEKLS
jgi:hypothetical protein